MYLMIVKPFSMDNKFLNCIKYLAVRPVIKSRFAKKQNIQSWNDIS